MNTTQMIQIGQPSVVPEFLPMPRPGQYCEGLGRAYLYKLAHEGKIQTVSLRERGKLRGKRLIVAESLRTYLRSQIVV